MCSSDLPRHPTVMVQSEVDRWSFVSLRHRTVRCATGHALFTVRCAATSPNRYGSERSRPLELCLLAAPNSLVPSDFAALTSVAALFTSLLLFAVNRCAQIAVVRWLIRQFGGTPDSPVNYSGARRRKPESGCLDPVRSWCTGHCPVAHRTVRCARPQHTWFLLLL